MMKTHYERNDTLFESNINCNFEDLLEMTPDEFTQWVINLRKTVVDIWENEGTPPRRGKMDTEIVDQFNKMVSYPVHQFAHSDELSSVEDDVIINKSRLGSEADQWFPHMYKTRINYTEKDNGYSIYDLFATDKYKERMLKGCFRHFRRDSMYLHALTCFKNNNKPALIECDDAETFIRTYHDYKERIFKGYDFMLEQVSVREGMNSGYTQVDQSNILQLTKEQVDTLNTIGMLEYRHHSTFDIDDMPEDKVYSIRLYIIFNFKTI